MIFCLAITVNHRDLVNHFAVISNKIICFCNAITQLLIALCKFTLFRTPTRRKFYCFDRNLHAGRTHFLINFSPSMRAFIHFTKHIGLIFYFTSWQTDDINLTLNSRNILYLFCFFHLA